MTFWTEDRLSELESLWDRGFSCALIGEMLGCTKNAVAGKAWRLQLPEREVLYTRPQRKRRGRPFVFRQRTAKVKPPARPRHNGDFSWHLAQVASGVAPRGTPPKPPAGAPSWKTFLRRMREDPEMAAQVVQARVVRVEMKRAA